MPLNIFIGKLLEKIMRLVRKVPISLFEEKYMEEFIDFMKKYNHKNIWNLFESLPSKEKNNLSLVNVMGILTIPSTLNG